MAKLFFLLITFSFLGAFSSSTVSAQEAPPDEDLLLTYNEKIAFDKFKSRVFGLLPQSYMKEDIYLVRWLRARDFNVGEAEKMLREDLKWRKETNIDKLNLEDFGDLVGDFPVQVDTYDKQGAPVITAIAGQWDVRKAQLTGQAPRVQLFLDKIMDDAATKVRLAQREGKNVTRFQFLLNLDGFNVIQHGCPRCFLEILTFIQNYENHFPGLTDKIVIFNAPPTIQAIRPLAFPRFPVLLVVTLNCLVLIKQPGKNICWNLLTKISSQRTLVENE